ncbi:sulfatase [Vibrio breoganii]
MSSSQLSVLVKHQEHCNIDSFPLRFGFSLEEDTECVLLLESEAKTNSKYKGRKLYEGTLIHPESDDYYSGTFVVAENNNRQVLVTAWRNDIDTEYYLSKVMQSLRESGVLDTSALLAFHPKYKNNELTTHADLVLALSQNKSASQVRLIEQRAEAAVADAKAKIEKLEQQNQHLEMQVSTLKQQSELKDILHEVRLTQASTNTEASSSDEKGSFWKGVSMALAFGAVIVGGFVAYQSMDKSVASSNPTALSEPPVGAITPDSALRFVDTHATVCGKVVQITDFAKGNYLNFDRMFPQTEFSVVIWKSDVNHVAQDESLYTTYSNQNVCVTGEVSSYNGRAQIIVKNPHQLSVY